MHARTKIGAGTTRSRTSSTWRALESTAARRLLWSVPRQATSSGVVVGGVAAAATTGALVAIGKRLGGVAFPFAAIGDVVLRRSTSSAVAAGVLIHVAAAFLWGAIYLWLVRRGWRDWRAAVLIGVAQLGSSWLIASATGRGMATLLPLGDRIALALVLSAALVAGMRFASAPGHHA
jgi:hypothetical protein